MNKLSLNLSKTKAMMFGNVESKSNPQIMIDGVQIETVNENTFLGVIIDNKLSWKAHIKHIKTKISKSLSIINKAKIYLDENALRTLYRTLVLPYFMYCVEVWGNTYQCTIDSLVKLQKRALRIIHKVGYLDHTHNLFIQSGLLKFDDLVKYSMLVILYKAYNKLLPLNLQKHFSIRDKKHNLRGYGVFALPRAGIKVKSFCVSVFGVKLWNSLAVEHKQCQNIHRFKKSYKNMVLSQYKENV